MADNGSIRTVLNSGKHEQIMPQFGCSLWRSSLAELQASGLWLRAGPCHLQLELHHGAVPALLAAFHAQDRHTLARHASVAAEQSDQLLLDAQVQRQVDDRVPACKRAHCWHLFFSSNSCLPILLFSDSTVSSDLHL